jgi:hypothetical protein
MSMFRTLLIFLYAVIVIVSCKKREIELPTLVHPDAIGFEKFYGGGKEDRANEVAILNDYLFVVGTTESFGEGNGDILLLKLDDLGKELLRKTYGGAGKEEGEGIIRLNDNNLLIIGSTESFGGCKQIYLVKIDASGNEIWTQTFGGPAYDAPFDVIEHSNGELSVLGSSTSFGSGDLDILYMRFGASGDVLFHKVFGGAKTDGGADIIETSSGELMMFCYTASEGAGDRDLMLLKTNQKGDSLWSKTYGGADYEESQTIRLLDDGGYLLCGHSASIDPIHNMYALRLKEDGSILWEKNYGGNMHDGGQVAIVNSKGNYVLVARSMSFGNGDRNAYLVEVSASDGSVIQEQLIGGEKNDRIDDIIEFKNHYYLVGHSDSDGAGMNDAYVVKIEM